MPELPEVETIVRELDASLPGHSVMDVRVFRDNALSGVPIPEFRRSLLERRFQRVTRKGKFLLFALQPEGFLVAHLRMTGKFILSPSISKPEAHHRVWFMLDGGPVLVFQDLRCFGTLAVVDRLENHPSLARLGLDPLSRGFTPGWLAKALHSSRAPLKHWLMDQGNIAGLGNIYVSEILFAAGLSPLLPAKDMGKEAAARLHRHTRRVLYKAVRMNGTTISDYRRVDDKTGEFQNFLRVYGKADSPCPVCRTPILRIRQQQRSTFYCPRCQG